MIGQDRDILPLAALINQVDTAPIGVHLEELGHDGALVLLFDQLMTRDPDAISFYASVNRWRYLLGKPSDSLLAATVDGERNRVLEARDAPITMISDKVALIESPLWGFDVWYENAPIILKFSGPGIPDNITVGAPSDGVAEDLYGPGGLSNLWPQLLPEGWGGRGSIGGSPRGAVMTREQALAAAHFLADNIQP
jgi:hypothetical protein